MDFFEAKIRKYKIVLRFAIVTMIVLFIFYVLLTMFYILEMLDLDTLLILIFVFLSVVLADLIVLILSSPKPRYINVDGESIVIGAIFIYLNGVRIDYMNRRKQHSEIELSNGVIVTILPKKILFSDGRPSMGIREAEEKSLIKK